MHQQDKQKKSSEPKKIRLGRLAIDPVFLVLFTFFAFSALLLQIFIWFSLRP